MITDWLMVVITAVYVIATCFIWKANNNSAKATKEQVNESRRQFDETRRLDMLPYLQFESMRTGGGHTLNLVLVSHDLGGGQIGLSGEIKNVGKGTAKEITYCWNSLEAEFTSKRFPIPALLSGDCKAITFYFAVPKKMPLASTASLELFYSDLLEHEYKQTIEFHFSFTDGVSGIALSNFTVSSPVYIAKDI